MPRRIKPRNPDGLTPEWYRRLPEIIEGMKATAVPVVDRQEVERLFRVKTVRANELMRGELGKAAFRAGGALLLDRVAALKLLVRLTNGDRAQREIGRSERLRTALDKAAKQAPARAVTLELSREEWWSTNLPQGVQVNGDRMIVDYAGAEDLLRKLMAVAVAAQNDLNRFRTVVDGRLKL